MDSLQTRQYQFLYWKHMEISPGQSFPFSDWNESLTQRLCEFCWFHIFQIVEDQTMQIQSFYYITATKKSATLFLNELVKISDPLWFSANLSSLKTISGFGACPARGSYNHIHLVGLILIDSENSLWQFLIRIHITQEGCRFSRESCGRLGLQG